MDATAAFSRTSRSNLRKEAVPDLPTGNGILRSESITIRKNNNTKIHIQNPIKLLNIFENTNNSSKINIP